MLSSCHPSWFQRHSLTLAGPSLLTWSAVVWVGFLGVVAPASAEDGTPLISSDLYRQASEAYRASDFARANELYAEVLQREDLSPEGQLEVLLLSAKCNVVLGDALHVRESLRRIREIDPQYRLDLDRHRCLADAYFEVFGTSVGHTPGVQTIGVLDFDVAIVSEDARDWSDLGTALGHMFSSALAPATNLDVVERIRLQHVLAEIDLSESGAVSQETLVQAGKLAGAQSLLFGALVGVGKRYELHARIVHTEEGKQVSQEAVSFEGDLDKIFDVVRDLSKKTAGRLEGDLKDVGDLGWNLEAERSYARALRAYDIGDVNQAVVHCQMVLELDPEHADAQVMLEELHILAGGAIAAN